MVEVLYDCVNFVFSGVNQFDSLKLSEIYLPDGLDGGLVEVLAQSAEDRTPGSPHIDDLDGLFFILAFQI